jgi:glutathione synthase/RimK-type ligase-like ATP-grasp enzyme
LTLWLGIPILKDISIKSAKALKLNWTGTDIVRSTDNGKYYVLELNRRPGLTEESTEITTAYDHILSILAKKGMYIES